MSTYDTFYTTTSFTGGNPFWIPWTTRNSSCENIGNITSDHKRTIFKRRFAVSVDFWPVVKLVSALSVDHPNRFCKPIIIHTTSQ